MSLASNLDSVISTENQGMIRKQQRHWSGGKVEVERQANTSTLHNQEHSIRNTSATNQGLD